MVLYFMWKSEKQKERNKQTKQNKTNENLIYMFSEKKDHF